MRKVSRRKNDVRGMSANIFYTNGGIRKIEHYSDDAIGWRKRYGTPHQSFASKGRQKNKFIYERLGVFRVFLHAPHELSVY